jgi:uncharacterized membrane protein
VTDSQRYVWSTVAIGVVALGHALLTWPLGQTVAVFAGGATLAFVAEVVGVHLGLLEHHLGRKLLGAPLYVLFGWTGLIYVAVRLAMLVTAGLPAVLLAAVLTTTYDLLVDHRGVADGYWTYTDDLPGPRHRGVPWWNYAAWFVLTASTASLALYGTGILS